MASLRHGYFYLPLTDLQPRVVERDLRPYPAPHALKCAYPSRQRTQAAAGAREDPERPLDVIAVPQHVTTKSRVGLPRRRQLTTRRAHLPQRHRMMNAALPPLLALQRGEQLQAAVVVIGGVGQQLVQRRRVVIAV